ncbi:hypothetical protein LUZ60_015334 [Juncus effusus]|nr:hypothetical protein LUZ60_015334 [Juncus effusus]
MYRTSSTSSSSYGDNQEPFNPSIFISSNQVPPTVINGHFSSSYANPSPHSYNYSSSFPSNSYNSYLHRSDSSQSLPMNHYMQELANKSSVFSSSSPSSSSGHEFVDFYSGPMRRVFSTGDLQGMNNGSQVSGENSNSNQEMINGTGKVVRYSAEERKERIEKYRSKRNHRNFQKKITYACRKTLADSRPRVKGRFARNGELEVETEAESEATGQNNPFNYNSYNNSNNYNSNGICYNNANGISNSQVEWWRQIEETLEAEDEGESSYYDEQMWVLSDVLSMNLLS